MIHPRRLKWTAAGVAGILVLLGGCAAPDTPSGPTTQPLVESGAPVEGSVLAQLASELPAWIVEPSTLPVGRTGKNDCTFPFGQDIPQWDFHPDAGCWEHAGPCVPLGSFIPTGAPVLRRSIGGTGAPR
jgi:hypothetical protein